MTRDLPDDYEVIGTAPYLDAFGEYLHVSGSSPDETEQVEDDALTEEAVTQDHETAQEEYR